MGPVNPTYVDIYIYIRDYYFFYFLPTSREENGSIWILTVRQTIVSSKKILLDYPDSYRNVTKIRNTMKITKQSYIFATKNEPTPRDVAKRNLSSFLQKIVFATFLKEIHISKGNSQKLKNRENHKTVLRFYYQKRDSGDFCRCGTGGGRENTHRIVSKKRRGPATCFAKMTSLSKEKEQEERKRKRKSKSN